MAKKIKLNMQWYKHPVDGYMLRHDNTVVTSLCLNNLETESDPVLWEKHKSRLHVNGGCGAIAADEMLDTAGRNPEYVPVQESEVPAHIVKEFKEYV